MIPILHKFRSFYLAELDWARTSICKIGHVIWGPCYVAQFCWQKQLQSSVHLIFNRIKLSPGDKLNDRTGLSQFYYRMGHICLLPPSRPLSPRFGLWTTLLPWCINYIINGNLFNNDENVSYNQTIGHVYIIKGIAKWSRLLICGHWPLHLRTWYMYIVEFRI